MSPVPDWAGSACVSADVAVGALYLLINALVSSGAAVAHRRLLAHR